MHTYSLPIDSYWLIYIWCWDSRQDVARILLIAGPLLSATMAWVAWTNSSPRRLFALKWLRERFMCYFQTNEHEWGNYNISGVAHVVFRSFDISPLFFFVFCGAGGWSVMIIIVSFLATCSYLEFQANIPLSKKCRVGYHVATCDVEGPWIRKHGILYDIVEISMESMGEIHGKHTHTHNQPTWKRPMVWWWHMMEHHRKPHETSRNSKGR